MRFSRISQNKCDSEDAAEDTNLNKGKRDAADGGQLTKKRQTFVAAKFTIYHGKNRRKY